MLFSHQSLPMPSTEEENLGGDASQLSQYVSQYDAPQYASLVMPFGPMEEEDRQRRIQVAMLDPETAVIDPFLLEFFGLL
jgi:hypothetical protein